MFIKVMVFILALKTMKFLHVLYIVKIIFHLENLKSDLDVELDNGLSDHEYLAILEQTLKNVLIILLQIL